MNIAEHSPDNGEYSMYQVYNTMYQLSDTINICDISMKDRRETMYQILDTFTNRKDTMYQTLDTL